MFKLAEAAHSNDHSNDHSSDAHPQDHTVATTEHGHGGGGGHHVDLTHWKGLGTGMVILNVLPFVSLLLMIAILPLIPKVDHWWHQNKNKLLIASICGILGIGLYYLPTGDFSKILHTYIEYFAFIMLLASLFIISGGIHISGAFAGFPHINTIFLGLGAVLANLMGTTGASMLLIRPLINANKSRKHKTHIMIFFIFAVSNCGGLLTPLGDPPLYMGFLRGVPFEWTLKLIPEWAFVVVCLLFIFHLLDSYMFTKEELEDKESLTESMAKAEKKLHIDGAFNLGFLFMIVVIILLSGYVVYPMLAAAYGTGNASMGSQIFQVFAMGLTMGISYKLTPVRIREANEFSFEPILEVACIFVGIFGAMIPALTILEAKGNALALTANWHYFWVTGILSGFLDNAPTYLTFVTLASSKHNLPTDNLSELASGHPELLAAISAGAVFMGALTYIGNGPNFMVKTIAEHSGIKMPSFGGYIVWSAIVLVPLLVISTFIFFMH